MISYPWLANDRFRPWIQPVDAIVCRYRSAGVGALLLEQTDEWTIQRRYLTLETMASVGDTALASVSAVAR